MPTGRLNWPWLLREMERRGMTWTSLAKEHHFSRSTLEAWDSGGMARPHSLRKLAGILGVTYTSLVQNIGIKPMSPAERRALTEAARSNVRPRR